MEFDEQPKIIFVFFVDHNLHCVYSEIQGSSSSNEYEWLKISTVIASLASKLCANIPIGYESDESRKMTMRLCGHETEHKIKCIYSGASALAVPSLTINYFIDN